MEACENQNNGCCENSKPNRPSDNIDECRVRKDAEKEEEDRNFDQTKAENVCKFDDEEILHPLVSSAQSNIGELTMKNRVVVSSFIVQISCPRPTHVTEERFRQLSKSTNS